MIIAALIYILAHTGVVVAPPLVINILAVGSIASTAHVVEQTCKHSEEKLPFASLNEGF